MWADAWKNNNNKILEVLLNGLHSMNIERANRIGYAESLAHTVDLDLGTLVCSSRGVVPFAGSSAHAHGGS